MDGSGEAALRAIVVAAHAAADRWEWVLIAGLVLEFIILLVFTTNRRERLWLGVGNIMVVAGVAGAWFHDSRATDASQELQRIADRRVASLNRKAESLRRANLLLEKSIQPRLLKRRRMVTFATKAEACCKGQRVQVQAEFRDIEASTVLTQLLHILGEAKWDTSHAWAPCCDPSIPTGVLVTATGDRESRRAMRLIVRQLELGGLRHVIGRTMASPLSAGPGVVVTVGYKPLPREAFGFGGTGPFGAWKE